MMRNDNEVAWLARFPVAAGDIGAVEEKLGETFDRYHEAPVLTLLEEKSGTHWRMEILFAEKPAMDEINQIIENGFKGAGLPPPGISWDRVEARDWVAESQKLLPPIEAGRFFVYGSHDQEKLPDGKIGLEIEAGPAFGTGQHETTKGCLVALDRAFREGFKPKNALDLGCGSGILALAIAKLWPDGVIIGSDIDPISVETAIENARKNHELRIRFLAADGLDSPEIAQAQPFDLIVSNILAGPLIAFAPAIWTVAQPGGMVILSGLMRNQESETLAAYQQQGFQHIRSDHDGEWVMLTLQA